MYTFYKHLVILMKLKKKRKETCKEKENFIALQRRFNLWQVILIQIDDEK